MSTIGQFSSKNPTTRRILKEAAELAGQPSSDYYAAPLESDLFEWHFTIRGPPAPSPYDGGIYHGRIILPPAYPLKPPSFRFLTPTGRFEVNREICLSISGHHEETWQPAWGIRTALVAIRSFMDTSAAGQLGGMEANEEVRKRLASQSPTFKCTACAKTNGVIMQAQAVLVQEQDTPIKEDVVPEELRLAYREDLSKVSDNSSGENTTEWAAESEKSISSKDLTSQTQINAPPTASTQTTSTPIRPATTVHPAIQEQGIPAWIDKAIYGIVAALLFLLWKKLVQ